MVDREARGPAGEALFAGDVYLQLSKIAAAGHVNEGLRRLLETVGDVFEELDSVDAVSEKMTA